MTSISRGKTCKHQASQEVEVGKDGTNKRRKELGYYEDPIGFVKNELTTTGEAARARENLFPGMIFLF
jgi:hypothetical protein